MNVEPPGYEFIDTDGLPIDPIDDPDSSQGTMNVGELDLSRDSGYTSRESTLYPSLGSSGLLDPSVSQQSQGPLNLSDLTSPDQSGVTTNPSVSMMSDQDPSMMSGQGTSTSMMSGQGTSTKRPRSPYPTDDFDLGGGGKKKSRRRKGKKSKKTTRRRKGGLGNEDLIVPGTPSRKDAPENLSDVEGLTFINAEQMGGKKKKRSLRKPKRKSRKSRKVRKSKKSKGRKRMGRSKKAGCGC